MRNIIWKDEVFGIVPEEFRAWYLEKSGTSFVNGRWVVDGQVIETRKDKKGNLYNIYKATLFEKGMITARNRIREIMEGKSNNYIISNKNIFELMRDKKTEVKYKHQGQDFIQIIN